MWTVSDSDEEVNAKNFSKSLKKLQDTDPEFYGFLKENDEKLLNLNFDSDSVSDDEHNDEEVDEIHKPSDLQEDSEDSDFEEKEITSYGKLTLKVINEWQTELQTDKKPQLHIISNAIKAFHAALLVVSSNDDQDEKNEFTVEGSGVFNSIIQMCVLCLPRAVKKFLGLQHTDKSPQKCKRWVKLKSLLKTYFKDLFKLLGNVTSVNILNVLLKHLHQMSLFIGCFPTLTKLLFKKLVLLWSSSEDTIRVLAFLCILRVTRNNQAALLDNVLKMMYISYVKNCKFVSLNTKPGISFMRKSLVEMFALDVNVSYQHVFLYIRQLAIHMRNALTLRKKEHFQAVYNWQFVNSLQLWAELLSSTHSKPQLQPLIYPLVTIITNTIKLIPTAQYYPLRFHCVQILINLSASTGVYIPILPLLLEVLTLHNFSKKHKKMSMKPIDFSCILRLSKSHLTENGFKDAVIDNVYNLLLETLCIYSNSISFPDIVITCVIQLKLFLKNCQIANYCKKIRLILDKIEENTIFIESEKRKTSLQLNDLKGIKAWESNIKNIGTPLQNYYFNWKKLNIQQRKIRETKNSQINDDLPIIKRKKQSSEKMGDVGSLELFPSDAESDVETINEASPPPAKKFKGKKKIKKVKNPSNVTFDNIPDDKDVVKDFDVTTW